MVGDLSFTIAILINGIKMYSTMQTNVTPDKQYFDKNVPRANFLVAFFAFRFWTDFTNTRSLSS